MYDLIAIDLDGTLLGPDGKVSERNKQAVRRAIDAGFLVVVATGRNWSESRAILDEIDHRGQAIFVGGAVIVDTHQQTVVHRQGVEPEVAAQVCEILVGLDLAPLILQDRELAGHDFIYGDRLPPEHVLDWHRRNGAKTKQSELEDIDHSHTLRISALGPPQLVDTAEAELQARFGERLFCYTVGVRDIGMELIEVFDPSVNKWAGIERVANDAGISLDRTVAIGDDNNDLHMIQNAGLGVAMGNARDTVKAIADRIIGSHHEDGLAAFLDELVEARGR